MPGILVAVVGATAVVGLLGLAARTHVAVLGQLPQGLPGIRGAVDRLCRYRAGPARRRRRRLVSFADTSSVARLCARTATQVDPKQEMVGLGAANLAAGFFQGFPIGGIVADPGCEAAGARTQLAGVVGAVAVACCCCWRRTCSGACPPPRWPRSHCVRHRLDRNRRSVRIFRIPQWEFWLSVVCFVGVAVFGAIPGIGLAIVMR